MTNCVSTSSVCVSTSSVQRTPEVDENDESRDKISNLEDTRSNINLLKESMRRREIGGTAYCYLREIFNYQNEVQEQSQKLVINPARRRRFIPQTTAGPSEGNMKRLSPSERQRQKLRQKITGHAESCHIYPESMESVFYPPKEKMTYNRLRPKVELLEQPKSKRNAKSIVYQNILKNREPDNEASQKLDPRSLLVFRQRIQILRNHLIKFPFLQVALLYHVRNCQTFQNKKIKDLTPKNNLKRSASKTSFAILLTGPLSNLLKRNQKSTKRHFQNKSIISLKTK